MPKSEDYITKLGEYVKTRLEKGHKPKHIRKTLIEHGWKEDHIAKVLPEGKEDNRFLAKEEEKDKGVVVSDSLMHETDFDKLYNLVKERGRVKLHEVADMFKIDKKLAEKWAYILKKGELIDISESGLGEIVLVKK